MALPWKKKKDDHAETVPATDLSAKAHEQASVTLVAMVADWQQHELTNGRIAPISRDAFWQFRSWLASPEGKQSGLGADLGAGTRVRVERSPVEFTHLYAELERQLAGPSHAAASGGAVGAMTLIPERTQILGVTSTIGGEGKTSVALHLAMRAAKDSFKKVCLIDMSMGNDDLCRRLGLPSTGKGIVSILEETDQTLPTLQLSGRDNLLIMPAGRTPTNAARTVRAPKVSELLIAARQIFDTVIVDLPAITSDNVVPIATHLDALVLVARYGVTPHEMITESIERVGRERVAGVVLNRVAYSCPDWMMRRFFPRY